MLNYQMVSSSHGQEGEPLARPHCAATLGQASRAQGGGGRGMARGHPWPQADDNLEKFQRVPSGNLT